MSPCYNECMDTDTAINIGNRCVCCDRDTSPGTGLFVNRIPADGYLDGDMEEHPQLRDGYLCPECQCFECDVCFAPIPPDDDLLMQAPDGNLMRVCEPCSRIVEGEVLE